MKLFNLSSLKRLRSLKLKMTLIKRKLISFLKLPLPPRHLSVIVATCGPGFVLLDAAES